MSLLNVLGALLAFINCGYTSIGSNGGPELRFVPMPSDARSTLIWYKPSDKASIFYWQKQLTDLLETYKKENNPFSANIDEDCPGKTRPKPGKVCDFKIGKFWGPCLAKDGFNYNSTNGGPCVFLKLDRISGWRPLYYNNTNMPDSMPDNMKRYLDYFGYYPKEENIAVWVTCEGENPADIENIGPIKIIPWWGFSGKYFPFMNQEGYLSPLVAVYFEKPTRGQLIFIECKAWAGNIKDGHAAASVHFELLVDE